jgi:hypothetical protein
MFVRVSIDITEGKKKLTSKFIECLQGMEVNEIKWQSYNSGKEIKKGKKLCLESAAIF